MLELNDRLLVTSPRTAARRGAITAARRGQEQVTLDNAIYGCLSTVPSCEVCYLSRIHCSFASIIARSQSMSVRRRLCGFGQGKAMLAAEAVSRGPRRWLPAASGGSPWRSWWRWSSPASHPGTAFRRRLEETVLRTADGTVQWLSQCPGPAAGRAVRTVRDLAGGGPSVSVA